MRVADFDFELPAELIAQAPPPERGASRLMVVHRADSRFETSTVACLPDLLAPGDVLVVNDTKVFPARLLGHRVPSGGVVECLLLGRLDEERWDALVHPGQKLKPGARLAFTRGDASLHGEIVGRGSYGRRTVRLWSDPDRTVDQAIDVIGHVPLPPYIKRPDEQTDRDRYQTVFASARGSVAAPTAGLHFTEGLLSALDRRGVERVAITLHVGYGTFEPVRVEEVEAHRVDPERFSIGEHAAARINLALDEGRRVVAVGTTTTRALESAARVTGRVAPGTGTTDLFIYPGFVFRVATGLMTNFHVPRSSLLMLVCAFGGRDLILEAYRDAVARRFRFYSYGDAMVVL
jgi:S-adenosylmethionine:tRNA ribosyltransferase-isomerase